MSFRMPAEWEPHARTLIGWPCRVETWGETLAQGRAEFAAVANAIAAFEPVIWLERGLSEDLERDDARIYDGTDGHIDLFFAFIAPRRALMLASAADELDAELLAQSREQSVAAGVEVIDFPFMARFKVDRRPRIAPYLNFYICNGAVIAPVAGVDPDLDQAALTQLGDTFPDRELIALTMRAAPRRGGAIHCMTQQVPAATA